MNDLQAPPSGGPVPSAYGSLPSMVNPASQRQARASLPNTTYRGPPLTTTNQMSPSTSEFHPSQPSPPYATYPAVAQGYHSSNSQGPVLPPFSSIQSIGAIGTQQGNPSVRYHSTDNGISQKQQFSRPHNTPGTSSKRQAPESSNVTSANSSDMEDDDNGELPASGLVAPWEVLRGLADVAIERAAKARVHPHCCGVVS